MNDEQPAATVTRVHEADAYLKGALEDLADLMYAVDDLTREDGKRGFTKKGNREAALRHYLDAVACVRSAQEQLRAVMAGAEG